METKKRIIKCYIEEYIGLKGINARLREKGTTKRIVLGYTNMSEKENFLNFLSGGARVRSVCERNGDTCYLYNSTGYDKKGKDYILVEGNLVKETDEEIELLYDKDLVYLVV